MNQLIAKRVLGREATTDEAPTILDEYANTSSAGSVIAFHKHRGRFSAGDLGVLCSFGAGYSIGSVVLKKDLGGQQPLQGSHHGFERIPLSATVGSVRNGSIGGLRQNAHRIGARPIAANSAGSGLLQGFRQSIKFAAALYPKVQLRTIDPGWLTAR